MAWARGQAPPPGHGQSPGGAAAAGSGVQESDEPLTVSTDHPRLFLRPARLRLLRRERERGSLRWSQFDALVSGNAPMPERGFALALYYQVAGKADAGRDAVAWAMGPAADLRQLALVFDWCQDLLDERQRQALAERIEKAMTEEPARDEGVAGMRSRVLAAAALFDHVPESPRRELERARQWWNGKIADAMAGGRNPIAREDAYALFELLHAMRDNTNLDLREACPRFFRKLPLERLLSYYPAAYEASENDYRIGAARVIRAGPDLRAAALSRAADLEIVAFDTNATESQLLQGWLMHDRFLLRGSFGAPYEFLWANPYQPGLSYYHAEPVLHDADLGTLFARSSWDESAKWFGYFGGGAQLFENGRVRAIDPAASPGPLSLTAAIVCLGPPGRTFQVNAAEGQPVFLVGLEPRHTYRVEIDGQEKFEAATDPGGILRVKVPPGKETAVRVRTAPGARPAPRNQ
jgi:hypothetical protein